MPADADGHEPGGVRGVVCDVIPDGEDMVAWLAVGFIVVLLTGFYLWYWPGVRRWATAFVIRRGRGRFAFHMSVHKVVGLVVWLPLLVIAFTGAGFAFPAMKGWFQDVTPAQQGMELWSAPEEAYTSADAAGRDPITPGRVQSIIEERYPDREVRSIAPPYEEGGTWSAWVSRGFDPWTREGGAGNTWVLVDQFSGEVVYDGSPEDGNVFDQAWDDWSFPLHTGDFLGTATRVVWVVIGAQPARARNHRHHDEPRAPLEAGQAGDPRRERTHRTGRAVDRGGGARRRGGTVAGLNETLLRDLFATPPPDFVAARNEVVKALRKDKARDDATAVAALRRPGWDDWSLNTVATSDPDVVAGFIDAAAQVRDAQAAAIEGRDGPDIRTALRDLRDRSADLVRLADTAPSPAPVVRPRPGRSTPGCRRSPPATSPVPS